MNRFLPTAVATMCLVAMAQSQPKMMDNETQINELINSTIPIAEEVLTKQASIDPFAAYLDKTSEVKLIAPWAGPEPKTNQEQVAYFKKACLELRTKGEAMAFAVTYDAVLTDPTTGEKLTAIMNFVSIPPNLEHEIAAFYKRNGKKVTIQRLARIK